MEMECAVQSGQASRQMITNNSTTSSAMATPETLARLEDPRAWHARGEAGMPRSKSTACTVAAIARPMAPPPPRGRTQPVRKTVLEEDDYVERLGNIIESDYFPYNTRMSRALAGIGGSAVDGSSNTPGASGFVETPSSSTFGTPGGSTPNRARSKCSSGDRGGETKEREANGGDDAREAGLGGALTKFVATHTSEDNEAFAELQEKGQEEFRRRNFWAYDMPGREGKDISTKLLILPDGKMMSVARRELMDAACADKPRIGDDRPNQVETWKHRTRNQLMFSPNLAVSNDTCRIDPEPAVPAPLLLENKDRSIPCPKRPAAKQSSTSFDIKTKGCRDPIGERATSNHTSETSQGDSDRLSETQKSSEPDEVERRDSEVSTEPSVPRTADEEPKSTSPPRNESYRDDEQRKPIARKRPIIVKTNPKAIQAHATRFAIPKARPRQGPWASPIESPSSSRESVAEMLASGSRAQEEYSEVPMTPSRVPGVDGDSPQITWGSIDGTPMILDPRATPLPAGSIPGVMTAVDVANVAASLDGTSSAGGRQFEIKDLPAREKLAHRLEAEDTRRKKTKLGVGNDGKGESALRSPGLTTPVGSRTPGSSRRRESHSVSPSPARSTLTPAGRSLAARLAQRQGMDTPFGGALTPGPQKRRSSSTRHRSDGKGNDITPLPSGTPIRRGKEGSVSAVGARERSRAEGKSQSSLTDGLLAMKT